MKINQLGRSDLHVSELCLGTMTFGNQTDEPTSHEIMDKALAGGINFFDLAEMYPVPINADTQGRTEEYVGNWLAARGNRDQLILATKATGPGRAAWIRGEARRLNRANLTQALDDSLKRMKTDYVDLYQMHWPDRAVPLFGAQFTKDSVTDSPEVIEIEETLGVLEEFVQVGKVRAIGVSNETAYGTAKWIEASERSGKARIATIQNAYSLVNRTFEIGLAEVSLRAQVSLIPYAPVAAGFLTGKYLDGALPEGARYTLYPEQRRYRTATSENAIKAYVALAAELGITPAHLALAFTRAQPFVASTIAGARTVEHLESMLTSTAANLDADGLAKVNEIHAVYTNPCP